MAKFNVGDRVRPTNVVDDIDPAYLKMVGEVVEVVSEGFYVRFPDGKILDFYARELSLVASTKPLPTTDTKSLRAKYKAAPKEIDYDKPIPKDYYTNKEIRNATRQELLDSRSAAESDGGAGVIDVNGRSCFVEE